MHVRSRKPLQDALTATRIGQPLTACGHALQRSAEQHLRTRLRIDFLRLMFYGLLLAAAAGLFGLVFGDSFQQVFYWSEFIRGVGRLDISTPLLFDIGVYLVVVSVTSAIVMAMADEGEREDD